MNPIVIVVIALFVLLFLVSRPRSQQSNRRLMAAEADALLSRAESRMLLRQYSEAAGMYRTAYELGLRSGAGLLCAEASYGLARISLEQGDSATAVRYLEQ